jgi:hypothetical protein
MLLLLGSRKEVGKVYRPTRTRTYHKREIAAEENKRRSRHYNCEYEIGKRGRGGKLLWLDSSIKLMIKLHTEI